MPRYRMTIVGTLDTITQLDVKGVQADLVEGDVTYWRADSYDWPVTTVRVERVRPWRWPSWRLCVALLLGMIIGLYF